MTRELKVVAEVKIPIPEDATQFQLLTTGSVVGSVLSHDGYLYLSNT